MKTTMSLHNNQHGDEVGKLEFWQCIILFVILDVIVRDGGLKYGGRMRELREACSGKHASLLSFGI
jgi:hypothetical protein